jgi:ribosomal protein S18 acetylase RimI-like enzyme
MSLQEPIPLTSGPLLPHTHTYQALLKWPFPEQPFYHGQITRLLRQDIPQRVAFSDCFFFVYRDPDGHVVGFGALDVCDEYRDLAGGEEHCYIPLLAVHPNFQKRGHGYSIVRDLLATAALLATIPKKRCDLVFLDVYAANEGAIALYQKCGFDVLNPTAPIPDPHENNEPYYIMAAKLAAVRP